LKIQYLLASSKFIVDNAQKLNFQIGNQLERTQSIELVAEAGTNITANKEIISILQSELQVSNRKQFVSDAVIDVDNSITKSLEN
jgi:hypothetical protein